MIGMGAIRNFCNDMSRAQVQANPSTTFIAGRKVIAEIPVKCIRCCVYSGRTRSTVVVIIIGSSYNGSRKLYRNTPCMEKARTQNNEKKGN